MQLYKLPDYGSVQWMDAYLAEGLLGLCSQLVKVYDEYNFHPTVGTIAYVCWFFVAYINW